MAMELPLLETGDAEKAILTMLRNPTVGPILTIQYGKLARKIPPREVAVIISWEDILTDDAIPQEAKDGGYRHWIAEKIGTDVRNGLTATNLKIASKKTIMREEAVDMLTRFLNQGTKVTIVSSGIKQHVYAVLKNNGINPRKYKNLRVDAVSVYFDNWGRFQDHNTIKTMRQRGFDAVDFYRAKGIYNENIFIIATLSHSDVVRAGPANAVKILYYHSATDRKILQKESFLLEASGADAFVKDGAFVLKNYFQEVVAY